MRYLLPVCCLMLAVALVGTASAQTPESGLSWGAGAGNESPNGGSRLRWGPSGSSRLVPKNAPLRMGPPLPRPSSSLLPTSEQIASTIGAEYIEWFGMNLGAGYVPPSYSFGRIDLHFATINWANVYYTALEGNIFPYFGMAGVGGRLGWRTSWGKDEMRLGLRWGFAFWMHEDDDEEYGEGFDIGSDITPHIQYVHRYAHGTVGVGLDVPIYAGLDSVAGGFHIYFRWSVF